MNENRSYPARCSAAALAVTLLCLAGCGKHEAATQHTRPEVGVVTLVGKAVPLTTELPGRTSAFRIAEVRPQVNGIILRRLFTEGGLVRAGQPLYQIDPAPYQAALDSQKAALARAQARLKSATLLAQRYQPLAETRAVSQQAYDDAVASRDQAAADLMAAKAGYETARINFVYTKVLSPITGIVGRSAVTEGALVTANQPNALASVQQIDPLYVDVTQSSTQLLQLRQALANGQIQRAKGELAVKAMLTLEDGTQYDKPGKLQFSEVTVDQTTGSVTLRAVFPNPDHRLLPGMFVRASLSDGVVTQGLLVPQQGVTRNQRGEPTALVVNRQGEIEQRELKTDRAIGDQWLVSAGLQAGDRVVVEGLQSVKPGMAVTATEARTLAQRSQSDAMTADAGTK